MDTIVLHLRENSKSSLHQNLEILIFLLNKWLLIEQLDEIHLLIPMNNMVKRFENRTVLYWKNLQGNMASSSFKNQ